MATVSKCVEIIGNIQPDQGSGSTKEQVKLLEELLKFIKDSKLNLHVEGGYSPNMGTESEEDAPEEEESEEEAPEEPGPEDEGGARGRRPRKAPRKKGR